MSSHFCMVNGEHSMYVNVVLIHLQSHVHPGSYESSLLKLGKTHEWCVWCSILHTYFQQERRRPSSLRDASQQRTWGGVRGGVCSLWCHQSGSGQRIPMWGKWTGISTDTENTLKLTSSGSQGCTRHVLCRSMLKNERLLGPQRVWHLVVQLVFDCKLSSAKGCLNRRWVVRETSFPNGV